MQVAFMNTIYELASQDKNVVFCSADYGGMYDFILMRDNPEQYFDFGLSEEHMVAASAGMARQGKIPFVHTGGPFLAYRCYEFIRDDICFQNMNVKLIGSGSGLSNSMLGPTHHSTEDLALLRTLPNLTVLTPSTPMQVKKAIQLAYEINGPVYIRIGGIGEQELYDTDDKTSLYQNFQLKDGKDGVIFSIGASVIQCIKATELLEQNGFYFGLIDVRCLSPFDEDNIIQNAKQKPTLITVEEHQIRGGLGGAVAEVLADYRLSPKFLRIGLNNFFGKGYGSTQSVQEENELDAQSIYQKIINFVQGNK